MTGLSRREVLVLTGAVAGASIAAVAAGAPALAAPAGGERLGGLRGHRRGQ
jgi:hypothetical protein